MALEDREAEAAEGQRLDYGDTPHGLGARRVGRAGAGWGG